jgi:electron transport complex protein RnfC
MVRIGTPVKELVGEGLQKFDKVILGGPMMGHTIFDTEIPLTETIDCIYVQKSEESVGYRNNQCMSCGNCVNVCPVFLDVNLLCRFAEFSLFDKCQEMLVQACIECGLCAYHCPSGRALVQLIQLAKSEILKIQEGEIES